MMIKNLSIKSKLIFVTVYLGFSMVIGGILGISMLELSNHTVQYLYNDSLVKVDKLGELVGSMNQTQSSLAEAVAGQVSSSPDDAAKMDAWIDEINQYRKQNGQLQAALTAMSWQPEERAALDGIVSARKQQQTDAVEPILAALRAHNTQQAVDILQGPLRERGAAVNEQLDALMKLQLASANDAYELAQAHYHQLRMWAMLLTTVGVIVAGLMGWRLIIAITRPLAQAVDVAKRIAAGDLSQEIVISSRDEAGALMHAMKEMNDSLLSIVTKVRAGTHAITLASEEIATGNMDLSNRTELQANSLSKTAAATAEMTATVQQNTESAHHAQKVAATTRDMAEAGGQTMTEVVNTMAEISTSSKKIVDIISVIEGIAFQTNILALNAAVEAARAGEQGRGFAVVAGEVRSLAQRSSAAAKEIKTLINHSVANVKAGSNLVEAAGDNMEEILTVVGLFTDLLDSIYTASSQQSAGIGNINHSVSEMDEMTQQNAALVEQAAAAAQSMQDQAMALEQAVSVFKLVHSETHRGSGSHAHTETFATDEVKPVRSMPRKATDIEAVGEEWNEF
jgi:methyl-accepting chemotaxis protein-1 (serine sensor receptor)